MSNVWFGTKGYMQWVPAPAVDIPAGKQGYSANAAFLSGGAYSRRSKAAAKRFTLSWNMRHREDIQPVLDYADGIYGDGYIYYSNPFAIDRNALPAYWASPFINYYDGPLVVDGVRPDIINNNSAVNGYPVESAVYTLTSTSRVPSIYVPIPPGYTAHVGAHADVNSGSAFVRVTPEVSAVSSGTPVNLTLLSRSTTTRTNAMFEGDSYQGITVTMGSSSSGSLVVHGIIVQVLPNGAVPLSGGFVSGQGQSGMSFANHPSVSEYSAALDRVGVSVEMIETEAWAWQ